MKINKILKIFLFLLLCFRSLFGQNCPKNSLYIKKRKAFSNQLLKKQQLYIQYNFIQIDYLGLPIGIPYFYAQQNILQKYPHLPVAWRKNKKLILEYRAAAAWKKLQKEAQKASFYLQINSTYRTWAEQKELLDRYGKKIAENQGYSEHHIGTVIDIADLKANSQKFGWLLRNAFQMGWIPSYYFRHDSHIKKEAWHWRYVGWRAAQDFRCVWQKEIQNCLKQIK